MVNIYTVQNESEFLELNLSERSQSVINDKLDYIKEIVNNVKVKGDSAVFDYTKKFDGIDINQNNVKVTQEEFDEAFTIVGENYIKAIKHAIRNLADYHKRQLPNEYEFVNQDGICLSRKWYPIKNVGLYVPGGRAPYVTACYMLGVPAKIAGCENRVVCVPPDKKTGKVNPYVLVSAALSEVSAVYKVGGAQAIAAMAYGTDAIPKVGKIFGPGNVFVTGAKMLVYGTVALDSPAGPSEALIITDGSVDSAIIAADMLSQAEHDVDAAAIVLTTSKDYAKSIKIEVDKQLKTLQRKDIIEKSLNNFGAIVVCPSLESCIDIANNYAPEHIQIITKNSLEDSKKIVNSGSVCIGEYTPIAAGDYISGVNNVIPTGSGTTMFSPVHVEAYMKCSQNSYISKEALENIEEDLKIISEIEGFSAHYHSVSVRTAKGE